MLFESQKAVQDLNTWLSEDVSQTQETDISWAEYCVLRTMFVESCAGLKEI